MIHAPDTFTKFTYPKSPCCTACAFIVNHILVSSCPAALRAERKGDPLAPCPLAPRSGEWVCPASARVGVIHRAPGAAPRSPSCVRTLSGVGEWACLAPLRAPALVPAVVAAVVTAAAGLRFRNERRLLHLLAVGVGAS